ncbi:PREDICTED: inositol-trisphosphate 3-kinase A isoform X2 [Ceratosolen solmsi marchali]|uniref:Kinase n=1 Tax=Ceratosolen solmsi marchali TaxID=326594 RepID=A0AAJ6YX63_9HYME|nr:PREDICTED: inositol-trisphosphate 3-kinase A isoform X2 [Ceratosolen solmsi marchali]
MSSSVCHAPLPARMEAFTTRICLRAVDQYERLLQLHFKKPSSGTEASAARAPGDSPTAKEQRSLKNAVGGSYSAVSAFRQWKDGNSGSSSGRSSDAGSVAIPATTATAMAMVVAATATATAAATSTTTAATKTATRAEIRNHEHFARVLSDATMPEEDLSLKFLALNALDLTAPASDILLKNRLKSWFQLSGHPDGFAPAGPGTVWKRRTGGSENTERMVYEALSKDEALKDWIPRYYREVEYHGDTFIELQDLLFGFNEPHVMDIKLGTRTFLESEVSKTTARHDLYQKMIVVDPSEPTDEEHEKGAVTKLRYMQFRERQSSTCSHGFRIEAMKLPGSPPITDLKTVKSHEQVRETMRLFLSGKQQTLMRLLDKLKELREKIEQSEYFLTHEVIGSSIFMIYDNEKVGVWLIDFAKTCAVPNGHKLTHRREWQQGNHEEGFLFGLDNLILILEEVDCS